MHEVGSPGPSAPGDSWWRSAAIYQLYVRSFADGNGDGIGDLAGVRTRLSYLAGLGIDAIWFNPWYPSPMSDAGYDISDYRSIDPVFGTLADADALIAEALDEIARHLKCAAVDADVLAHQEHALVALERDGQRFANRLRVGEFARAHARVSSAGE